MITIAKQRTVSLDYKNLVISTLKEKYTYLLMGALLIVIAIISGLSILTKRGTPSVPVQEKSANNAQGEKSSAQGNKYTIKQGDNLWRIAETEYGSGYNYVDIAQANKIANPDLILSGQVVLLPKVAAKTPTKGEIGEATTGQVTFQADKFTVKQGDYLWKIALEAYGDGYGWTKIAKANNLDNPDLIFPDTKLSIPR